MSEEEEILHERHAELVNKHFLKGLTEEETAEKEQIEKRLDEINAPYYEPVIAQLKALKEALEKKGAA